MISPLLEKVGTHIRELLVITKVRYYYCTLRIIMACLLLWVMGLLGVGQDVIDSFLWKLAWHLLVPWKLDFREGDFRSVLAQWPVDPESEVYDIFRSRNLPSISGGTANGLCCLGSLLTINSKECVSCLVLGLLLGDFWLLQGTLSVQLRKFYLNSILYFHTNIYL